jgi:hypothetical protein
MDSFIIGISLLVFSLGGYLLWPSRYNVVQHMAVGGSFVSIVVPAFILQVQDEYPADIVNLYVQILLLGLVAMVPGLVLGFVLGKGRTTNLSFDIMSSPEYEQRVISITKTLSIIGIAGLVISYLVMGFVPVFAADPISAKLFRGPYQAPYLRVAVLYRASFFILSTIIPIAFIIWYKTKKIFFLLAVLAIVLLMAMSLARSGAFSGIILAVAIIMSFKGRLTFALLMCILVGIYIGSAFFYYIVGIRTLDADTNIWQVITAGTPDIQDHLNFLIRFQENPVWTYGRTIYGGLIPGHYQWNPSVYTLNIVAPGIDINEVGSGGLRLPLPMWGYVSFKWVGVIVYSFLSGLLGGFFLQLLKNWIQKFDSIIIRTSAVVIFLTVIINIVNFTTYNMYFIPPIIVMLFYMYRFKWK